MSITSNNASANDTMVSAVATIIAQYHGPADHVWCMAHIVNLVVQITLRHFDAPNKKKKGKNSGGKDKSSSKQNEESDGDVDVDDAEDLDIEEMDTSDAGDREDDVVDGIDDIEMAMKEDMAKATKHVKPVKEILSKVCSHPI